MDLSKNNSKRAQTRLFYHRGRRPKVLFALGSKIMSGELVDRSEEGIGVKVASHEDISVDLEQLVPKLYVDLTEESYCIENLSLVYTEFDSISNKIRFGFQARDAKSRQQLGAVMLAVMERGMIKANSQKLFLPDRLPSSSRAKPFKEEAIQERHDWLEDKWNERFPTIRQNQFDPESLAGNIENYIGAVQIPLGVAGPVLVRGLYTNAHIPIPIATTEGALVSSITRGARACSMAGGIHAHVIHQTMLRAPTFHFKSMEGAINFTHWLESKKTQIIQQAESVSSIAKVTDIQHFVFGDTVHVKFYYSTGDAAGQNMTTACTYIACEWIAEQISQEPTMVFLKYKIEGNLSGDKKVNMQNFISGRGISAVAECTIPEDIMLSVLKVSSRELIDAWITANVGARQIGMVGVNINFANVIAGIFAATGQDIASVHESSLGILNMSEKDGGLYICAYLPSLVIGTVGGGTGLPTQKECLRMMDCSGQDRVFRLAEIIAATCLSLDLSTGAAIAAGHFVTAHEKLGRNRPESYIKVASIDHRFFNEMVPTEGYIITKASLEAFTNMNGATASLMEEKRRGSKGLFKFNLETQQGKQLPIMLKLKSSDHELMDLGLNLMRLSGEDRLPGLFELNHEVFGFTNSHVREVDIYRHMAPELRDYLPKVYGSAIIPERDLYALSLQDLTGSPLLDSVNHPELWTENYVKAALKGMAHIHSQYLNQPDTLPSPHIDHFNAASFSEGKVFLEELTRYVGQRYPEITGLLPDFLCRALGKLHIFGQVMQSYHQTLTHGDFNPRNLCFTSDPEGKAKLCLYDWELAQYHNPQRDLVEFLTFVIPAGEGHMETWARYVDIYRSYLQEFVDFDVESQQFERILYCNALLFALTRMNLYCLAHHLAKFEFLERVYGSLAAFILNHPMKKEFQ